MAMIQFNNALINSTAISSFAETENGVVVTTKEGKQITLQESLQEVVDMLQSKEDAPTPPRRARKLLTVEVVGSNLNYMLASIQHQRGEIKDVISVPNANYRSCFLIMYYADAEFVDTQFESHLNDKIPR